MATPSITVKFGKFSGTTYDVSTYARQVTITRGRSRELDKFNTGTASITFNNRDRRFDPLNTTSSLYPDVKPRRDVQILTGSTALFTGIIDDISLDYDVSGNSVASFNCVDGFALLAQRVLTAHTATSQYSGERIGAVLSRTEVAWGTALRQLDTGAQLLQADIVDANTDALSYLQLVEASEPGFFFINRAGTAQYEDRNSAAVLSTATFTDVAGSAIPYTSIGIQYGQENLYNRVQITRNGGALQRSEDSTSQTEYGISTLDQTGLLIDTDANAKTLADYLLGKYKDPEYRIEEITVELASLSAANQATVLARELTDVVQVKFTPNKTGSQIVQYGQIIGIRHDIRPDSHQVSFSLAQTDGKVAFVFDSSEFGVFDEDILGF